MPVHNTDIAAVFDEIADFLEIGDENPFRIRAYRNAARTVRALGPELRDMVDQQDDLTQLPGIGKELAAKIVEILATGTARALKKLQAKYPQTLRDLLKIPGLGPKRVRVIYQDLGIDRMTQLIEAARAGRISELSGFGTRTEKQILETAESMVEKDRRFKIAEVKPHADSLTDYLENVPGVNQVIVAGSYRRAKETVGDLDILVTARKNSAVMDRFVEYEEIEKVLSKGTTRSSVILHTGLQVDLRLVENVSFGAALQYFTGSQAHNIAIRRIGRKKGLKINEYGVYTFEKRVAGKTEAERIALKTLPPSGSSGPDFRDRK